MSELTPQQATTVESILERLDSESEGGTFPYPQHDRMDYAAMRVHAYRSSNEGDDDYALFFEMLMFDGEAHRIQRFHGFCNQVFFYTKDDGQVWEDSLLPATIAKDPDGPSVSMTEESEDFIEKASERVRVNPAAKAIMIRGKRVPVSHDREVYEKRNIEPSDPLRLRDLLRLLVETHRDEIFSTDEERAKLLPGMKKILTLDEFEHFTMDLYESPSESDTMRMLAEVCATGDASRYKPTAPPNTYWRVMLGKDDD